MNDAQRAYNRNTHRWANDGDPADGNVVCRDCDSKPGHKTANQTCIAANIQPWHPSKEGLNV